jgi:competence protein ComEC
MKSILPRSSHLRTGLPAWMVLWSLCSALAADGKLEVRFFNVGQADAVLITCPDAKHRMLIDAADTRYPNSSEWFKAELQKELKGRPSRLALVVASHPHADHIGNMQWVLERFEVGTYVDNGQKTDAAGFGRLETLRRQLVKTGKLKYVDGKKSSFSRLDFCAEHGVEVEIFTPSAVSELSDTNDRSVAVRLQHGKKSFLFVGDMEEKAEKVMLERFDDQQRKKLDVDVLKVGHHGSDTSSSVAFINAVSPQIAIVSCGERGVGTNTGYKHPRLSTVRHYSDWFKNHSPPVHAGSSLVWAYEPAQKQWKQQPRPEGLWLTVVDGSVTVRSNGQELEVVK